ncbi:MAG TPA: cation transporter [Bacteroidales bacterium]|nr:cation transporter [Bacteroidales bacterium]HOX76885.1 cation transporter [Bacteroidales bacterium]HPI85154.1 cation transporter [Bacteroidales bacterium]HPM92664.1 cation transporter [Bacteroidales bacterium]
MAILKFKTTIKCNGCIKAVTPGLDTISDIKSWKVDLNSPDRILTVEGDNPDAGRIMEALKNAGYKSELI